MCDLKKLVVRRFFRLGTSLLILGCGTSISLILVLSNHANLDSFTQFIPAILGIIGGFVWLQYEWHLIYKNELGVLD